MCRSLAHYPHMERCSDCRELVEPVIVLNRFVRLADPPHADTVCPNCRYVFETQRVDISSEQLHREVFGR
jgi:hypothetical protein